MRDDSAECLILGYLDGQDLACALGERTPRPQDDAVRVGIARGDPLRIKITPLMPFDTRTVGRSGPCERSTNCCCSFEKRSAGNFHRLTPCRLLNSTQLCMRRQLPIGSTSAGLWDLKQLNSDKTNAAVFTSHPSHQLPAPHASCEQARPECMRMFRHLPQSSTTVPGGIRLRLRLRQMR
jgi:hypothetical protein